MRVREKKRSPGCRALPRGADDQSPRGHRRAGQPGALAADAGQDSGISQAPALLEGFSPERVIADKGYDADSFIDKIRSLGAEPVIPPRSNRVEQREYDRHWYKNRNLVERFFNRIKQFRRIATRYEKLDRNFMAMIDIACICIWLL